MIYSLLHIGKDCFKHSKSESGSVAFVRKTGQ